MYDRISSLLLGGATITAATIIVFCCPIQARTSGMLAAGQPDINGPDSEFRLIAERMAVKTALLADLAQGRTTLAEVVERFRDLAAASSIPESVVKSGRPNISIEEAHAISVLSGLRELDLPIAERDALHVRLSGEYERLYGRPSPSLPVIQFASE